MTPGNNTKQKDRWKIFHNLHHSTELLVLPNIWDPLGGMLLEKLGFPAVATASASVAFSNGYNDGEHIPLDELLALLKRIVTSIDVPVSADIESGYATSNSQLKQNIRKFIETGIVGINIEDTDKKTNSILPVEIQIEKIGIIKQVSEEMAVPLFINARTDIYIRGVDFITRASKLEETVKRGKAYKAAGADCFFPIALFETDHIKELTRQLKMPVNISLIQGAPKLNELKELGVARVSMGPSLLRFAIKAMQSVAIKLKKNEGELELTENELTTAYLKDLVNKV